jgi:N6-adenosine-specific RNA methylase IME4
LTAFLVRDLVSEAEWCLPADLTEQQWADIGRRLGKVERSVQWWIGEWWMFGEAHIRTCKTIVTADDWDGPAYQTCVNAANCCRSFPSNRRRLLVPFSHHAEVASLPAKEADELLDQAQHQAEQTGKPPGSREIRNAVKQRRRAQREAELADATKAASEDRGTQLFGVIYADPPWRFEPYSRDTGMDRAADNHYPTMDVDAICAIQVPAADDAVLFLWATTPMLPEALRVMAAWGFVYRSFFVWHKNRIGTGYWNRNEVELLLIGTRGQVPAPAPGQQYRQVIEATPARHSEKPAAVAEMIEDMFPSAALLEMFARAQRFGWQAWGNEVRT